MDERENSFDWFVTYTWRKFFPLAPRAEDVCIEDIAHGLSMICRFGGHCREFYSVAQHSVLVSRLVPHHMAFAGLMHDATEAYCGDMIRPMKRSMPFYQDVEHRICRAIKKKFGVALVLPPEVKDADNVALATERRDLITHAAQMTWDIDEQGYKAADIEIVPMGPRLAKAEFIRRFSELMAARLGLEHAAAGHWMTQPRSGEEVRRSAETPLREDGK